MDSHSQIWLAAEDADDYSVTPYLTVARWRDKTVEHQVDDNDQIYI